MCLPKFVSRERILLLLALTPIAYAINAAAREAAAVKCVAQKAAKKVSP